MLPHFSTIFDILISFINALFLLKFNLFFQQVPRSNFKKNLISCNIF
ncbi:hypothetical protein DCCM_4098 [Desulfocucumis palustris]|uniref:Uncharacterized protein n=1 Tax=Desulfocucumis palustris TaxID=1898651 RepID=A0A2L2XF57_9FIRM|nr:hypothetical protein DCCM_4098 [Desulfocucumis palustris]